MKTKWLAILLAVLMLLGTLASCDVGEPGPQGVQGEKGDQGEQGIQGEQGDAGEKGEQGDKGDKGDKGDAGADGITPQLRINETTNLWEISVDNGETWESLGVTATGEPGAQGEKGEKGDPGEKGNKGDQGDAGVAGEDGEDGEDGITPLLRINESTNMWEISYDNGSTWASLNVAATGAKGDKGDQGDQGEKGNKGDKGDKGDTGANGITPQLRISSTTNMWEVSYDNGATWASLNVAATGAKGDKGDKGDTGATGAQGPQGEKGDTGATGAQGPQGEKGDKGDKGDVGAKGNGIVSIEKTSSNGLLDTYTITFADGQTTTFTVTNGAQGVQGEQGVQGDKGDTGAQGEKGDKGDTGAQGEKGDTGDKGATGATIEKVEFDAQGRLVITLTDGTVLDPVELPTEHEHTYGEWTDFSGNAWLECTQKMYYRICSDCKETQWKTETEANHVYATKYSYDSTHHWFECTKCDARKNGGEAHTADSGGRCTVCLEYVPTANITYALSDDESYAIVQSYSGSSSNIVISNTYEGVPVREIQSNAFKGKNVTSLIIPTNVTKVSSLAFSDCKDLSSIKVVEGNTKYYGAGNCLIETETKTLVLGCKNSVIPSGGSVTSIGQYAFYGRGLTSITIPNSVTSIGNSAFCGCSGLTSITIPNSVTSIGNSAFYGCSGLTSITIPNGVTSVGYLAFKDCSGLTSITVANSVTFIGGHAFSGCSSLERITLPFVGKEAEPTSESHYPFGVVFGAQSYTGGVSTTQRFYNISNTNMTTVSYYIPATLKSVTITGGQIPYGAFYNCSNLTNVTIGDSVTSISDFAFYGCSGLTYMKIPFVGNSIKEEDDTYQYPFGYIFGTQAYTDGVATVQRYYGSSTSETTSRTYYIPASLRSVTVTGGNIVFGAFQGCSNINTINLNTGVKKVDNLSFFNCKGLTSITMSNSVTSVEAAAFSGCINLQTVVLSTNLTEIVPNAFNGCISLTSITIPRSVTSIGMNAFAGCSNLTSVTFENKQGWTAGGTTISSTDLENTSTAATYLKSTYYNKTWTRS